MGVFSMWKYMFFYLQYLVIIYKRIYIIKEICSKCGRIIKHNQICTWRTNISYNRNITPGRRKFYSSYAWQKLRNRKVKEHPYCERCWSKYKIIATENLQGYDIKSFKDYPELRLDEDNVVVLCRVCNLQIGDSSIKDW